jgi:hypothetical protein
MVRVLSIGMYSICLRLMQRMTLAREGEMANGSTRKEDHSVQHGIVLIVGHQSHLGSYVAHVLESSLGALRLTGAMSNVVERSRARLASEQRAYGCFVPLHFSTET